MNVLSWLFSGKSDEDVEEYNELLHQLCYTEYIEAFKDGEVLSKDEIEKINEAISLFVNSNGDIILEGRKIAPKGPAFDNIKFKLEIDTLIKNVQILYLTEKGEQLLLSLYKDKMTEIYNNNMKINAQLQLQKEVVNEASQNIRHFKKYFNSQIVSIMAIFIAIFSVIGMNIQSIPQVNSIDGIFNVLIINNSLILVIAFIFFLLDKYDVFQAKETIKYKNIFTFLCISLLILTLSKYLVFKFFYVNLIS